MKHDPAGRSPAAEAPINDALLRNYLADALPAEELARVEKALRDSALLRERLEEVRNNRDDFQLHSLGAIWKRNRLTCASRQQLGSLLLDALDEGLAAYIRFHIDVIQCPTCEANLIDLKRELEGDSTPSAKARKRRLFEATKKTFDEDASKGG